MGVRDGRWERGKGSGEKREEFMFTLKPSTVHAPIPQ